MSDIRRVTVSLDPETDDRLEAEAKVRKLSKSSFLRALLSRVFSGGFSL